MSADLSRIRLNPLLDWAGVDLKQGGVLLDADANELVAVVDRRLRALASDVLGRATVSQTTPNAFQLTLVAGLLSIGRGRLYVDGLAAECHGAGNVAWDTLLAEDIGGEPVPYDAQPYLPQPPVLPEAGRHLVYLDAWQREVTHVEDPGLVEIAVGVETSSRTQTAWQVRVLGEDAGNASCSTPDGEVPGWSALIAPSDGRLTTGTFEVPPVDDPCELPPSGGYRGAENHLYRVEIHDAGTAGGGATFKFSRENASVASRVASVISATELELDSLGRDDVLAFQDGDWVEIGDDVREFSLAPGEIRHIAVDVANRRISFTPALPAAMLPAAFPDSDFPAARNLRVRRWDQRGRIFRTGPGSSTVQVQDLDAPGASGVIDVPAAGTTLLLEDGITVGFSNGAAGFRSGDFWVFAARTADTSVETLDAAPPRGVHHHYARLGFWDVAAGTITDCRNHWPPAAGGADCSCSECVTPESHASGTLTLQAAVDRLRDSGGTVCLHAGTYVLAETLQVTGARSLTIRGQGPATVLVAPGGAIAVSRSLAIAVEKLAIVSAGRSASAIVLRTVAGVRLSELAVAVLAVEGRPAAISLQGLSAGVAIHDNLIIGNDGIRSETGSPQDDGGVPPVALTAVLRIEHNILSCRNRGIALGGSVMHLYSHRIAANQFLNCRDGGINLPGLAFPGAAMRVSDNTLNVNGNGIAAGVDGLWVQGNKLVAARQGERAPSGSAILLQSGLDPGGSDQAQILANQISGFSDAGIDIRSPVQQLICKLNIIESCGQGIVMSDDGQAGAVAIENNQISDIRGVPGNDVLPLTAGISVTRTTSATIAGNTLRRIGMTSGDRLTLTVGVSTLGVARCRIGENDVSQIGPSANFNGFGVGIAVRAPFQQAEIQHNHVQRDGDADALSADEALWLALMVFESAQNAFSSNTPNAGVRGAQKAGARNASRAARADFAAAADAVPGIGRAGNVATLRVDDRRTLVFAGNRAFVGVAAADADAVGAVQVRGGIAQVQANALSARGRMPAVVVSANGEAMISDNRVELIAGDGTTAVVLSTPVLVLSANRVRHAGPAVSISASKSVAALGNITSGNITVGGGPLPAPFADLNLIG